MSRATNDLSAVRMMIGPAVMYASSTGLTFIVGDRADGVDQSMADGIGARAAAVRLDRRPLLRRGDSPSVREDPGAALRHQRGHAGIAGRRPRRACLRTGGVRDRALPARERGIRRAQPGADSIAGHVLPEHGPAHGHRRAAGVVDRQPRGDCRAHDDRGVGGVQHLPDDARLADDRVWLGHESSPARHGVLETHAGRPRREAGDHRRACTRLADHEDSGRDRVPSPDVPLRRRRGAPRCLADDSRRHDDGDRRRHWIGEVDAAQPAASPARGAARHGLHRRRGRPGDSAGHAARCHRIRGAGAVSVQCVGRGQHRVWPAPSEQVRPAHAA